MIHFYSTRYIICNIHDRAARKIIPITTLTFRPQTQTNRQETQILSIDITPTIEDQLTANIDRDGEQQQASEN
jgi:hypothetical protein